MFFCTHFCTFSSPSNLTGFLHPASLPARLQSALQTPFPHINLTSPLKDWPHSKLLFKGKKNTHSGGGKRLSGVWAHPNGQGSPYNLAETGNDPLHPIPPHDWQIISLCHEVSPCVQVISLSSTLWNCSSSYFLSSPKKNYHHILFLFLIQPLWGHCWWLTGNTGTFGCQISCPFCIMFCPSI